MAGMEQAGVAFFEKGRIYTRQQIQKTIGGSRREALPTKGGNVVCACLTRRMNPRAPDEILVGGTERAVRRARAFAASGSAVPVFVKARRGGWEYTGVRRVRSVIEKPGALSSLAAEGVPEDASIALLLEEAPEGSSAAAQTLAVPPPAGIGI